MKNKIGTVKKITLTIGVALIMLSLLPMALPGQIGEIFADDDTPPETQEGNQEEGSPPETQGGNQEESAPPETQEGNQEEDSSPELREMNQNENEASEEETGVCGAPGCEALPAMEDGEEVPGEYTAASAIPETSGGAMTGDLTVDGTIFEDVAAVCGVQEDIIVTGTEYSFNICAVTDKDCINTIRLGQGQAVFTDEEADLYGRQFDKIFSIGSSSNNYNDTISAFRWLTGNDNSGASLFGGEASTSVSTWIGRPVDTGVQALAWYLDVCFDDGDPDDDDDSGDPGDDDDSGDPGDDDDDDDGPTPVSIQGPNDSLLIPVTGADLSFTFAGLQQMFVLLGMLFFGITVMLEGLDQKRIRSEK